MSKHLIILIFLFINSSLFAQHLQWQDLIGGSSNERGNCLVESIDGSVVFAAGSASSDIDIPANQGSGDVVLGKMQKDGSLSWVVSEGGNNNDWAYALENTMDGGYLAVGFTESTNGAYANNHGLKDGLILKFDVNGNLEWQKLIGGSKDDYLFDVLLEDDGSFIMVGTTDSEDGDLADVVGDQEPSNTAWYLKMDANGTIIWQKVMGTAMPTGFEFVDKGVDDGYIILGNQVSYSDLPDHYGQRDILLTKITSAGEVEWKKNFGGSEVDLPNDLHTHSGGYLVLGISESSDNDLPQNNGKFDTALLSISATGDLNWIKTYGANQNDELEQITPAENGNFLLSGLTLSKMEPWLPLWGGSSWLMLVDPMGETLSQSFVPQSESGAYREMLLHSDGSYFFIGTTDSPIEDFNNGLLDIWIGRYLINVNIITGKVYVDLNQNGMLDNDEATTNHIPVHTEQSAFQLSTHTSEGKYTFYVEQGDWISKIEDQAPYFSVPENNQPSSFSGIGETDELDFRLVVDTPIPDVKVNLIPLTALRPGFGAAYDLVIGNTGSEVLTGKVSLQFPEELLTFIEADESNLSTLSDQLEFEFSDLAFFQEKKIRIRFEVANNGLNTIGQMVEITSSVAPYSGELSLTDNIHHLQQIITGSYDPNDKSILTENPVTPSNFLDGYTAEYLIRFQNTGNDTAFTIVIADTLSAAHILESFQPIASSHSYRTTLSEDGSLTITYEDIRLVDSIQNEPESHGYFAFKIDMLPSIPVDSIIENKAHIYFDFNAAIVTNTTELSIQEPVIINSEEQPLQQKNTLLLFPNPVANSLQIEWQADKKEKVTLKIYSITGQLLDYKQHETRLGLNQIAWNCENLAKGAYRLSLDSNSHSITKHFTKQ